MSRRKVKRYRIRAKIAWMWDMDYLDKLNPREKSWILKFCDEFYHGAVKRLPVAGQIHKKRSQIKELYRNNNYRNKDLMNEYRIRAYAIRDAGIGHKKGNRGKPKNNEDLASTDTMNLYRVKTPTGINFKKFKG